MTNSKPLCCLVNPILCFNAECLEDLGCPQHFVGVSADVGLDMMYHGCQPCHDMIDNMMESMKKTCVYINPAEIKAIQSKT